MQDNYRVILIFILIILIIWLFWNRIEGFVLTPIPVPGSLKNISVGQLFNGVEGACGINSMNQVYCTDDLKNPNWKLAPTSEGLSFSNISIGDSVICGTDSNGNVYCSDKAPFASNLFSNVGLGQACNLSHECVGTNVSCCSNKCTNLVQVPCTGQYCPYPPAYHCPPLPNVGQSCTTNQQCTGTDVGCCNSKCTNLVPGPVQTIPGPLNTPINIPTFECPSTAQTANTATVAPIPSRPMPGYSPRGATI
jgi:hypothetical protein